MGTALVKQVWGLRGFVMIDSESTIKRYDGYLAKYGLSPESSGWGKKDRISERYQHILQGLDISDSLLDVGSGFCLGALICENFGIKSYHGIDLNENFFSLGLERLRELGCDINISFSQGDWQDVDSEWKFDHVVCSGLFNHKLSNEGNYELIEKFIKKFILVGNKSVSLNFLINKVDFKDNRLFYAEPAKIIELVEGCTDRYCFRKNSFKYEATLDIFPENEVNELAVYKEWKCQNITLF